jgi:hypothetical protein
LESQRFPVAIYGRIASIPAHEELERLNAAYLVALEIWNNISKGRQAYY